MRSLSATPTWLPGARVKSPRLRQGVKTANQSYLHAARKTTPIRENHAAVTLANDPAPSREKLVRYPPPPGPSETEFVLGEMIHSNTPFQAIFDDDDNKEEDAEAQPATASDAGSPSAGVGAPTTGTVGSSGQVTEGNGKEEEEEDDEDKLESETEDEEPEPEPAPVGRKAQLATSIRVAMKTDWVPLAKAGGYKVALFFQVSQCYPIQPTRAPSSFSDRKSLPASEFLRKLLTAMFRFASIVTLPVVCDLVDLQVLEILQETSVGDLLGHFASRFNGHMTNQHGFVRAADNPLCDFRTCFAPQHNSETARVLYGRNGHPLALFGAN